jgi:hypothetical protein
MDSSTLADLNTLDFTLSIAILLVCYKALSLAGQFWLSKKGVCQNEDVKDLKKMMEGLYAIYGDRTARKEIEEMHKMTQDTEKQKDKGHFKCVWQGRDEVRDFKDSMEHLVEATKALTTEMRLTRNGNGARNVPK